MADVARAAGVSRQTLYNEFGAAAELAQAFVLREADLFLDAVQARGRPPTATTRSPRWAPRSRSSSPRPPRTRWCARSAAATAARSCSRSSRPRASRSSSARPRA